MATHRPFSPLLLLTLLSMVVIMGSSYSISPGPSPSRPDPVGVKAAYWASFDSFPAASINTSYFTHIYYAFLLPDPATFELAVTPYDQEKLPEFAHALRVHDPPVKTILSIGGAGNDPLVFSQIASSSSTRATFIRSTVDVARKYGFDGVDLDWEFPINETDMANLGFLFKEWRKALDKEGQENNRPRLTLTAAVYFASTVTLDGLPRTYPGQAIRKYVDWVSPMCFDYHGSWDKITGEHSALYDPNSNISTGHGIQLWIQIGVPSRKIVMGLPLYGHTWKLQDPNVNGIGSPTVGVGPGNGVLVYSEIVGFNSGNDAVVKFDEQSASMYSYAGDSWVGYDDARSVTLKVRWARERKLGGYFFWALGQDMDWALSKAASYAWGN